MQVNYQYPSPSMCLQQDDQTILGLSPDLSREEKVSFVGKLKHPLIFRDAMLMLREIVISDMGQKKKERTEFFAWLDQEIDRRMLQHEKFLPGLRERLSDQIDDTLNEIDEIDAEIGKLARVRIDLNKQINESSVWKDYYKIERSFWKFIHERDAALWWVLDPVITVHPDQISFEAFSLDESTYGCLSVDMNEFDIVGTPQLGTTNIDFSAKLAKEMERFRTYTDVELSINPEGFTVDSGITPEYIEKKIELPESWIKGFNQVSAAATLGGIELELSQVDMYDICSYLRRHKAHKSPRYMKWILEPGEYIQIEFQPWGDVLELKTKYQGEKPREEKIWGRRRWLVVEKLIPIAESFTLRLLGFGMPQFIIANMGPMKMTIGFTSWSANDWVKGTSFNIMAGFIGEGNYEEIYNLLKKERKLTFQEIRKNFPEHEEKTLKAGLGAVLRRGEAYYDPIKDIIRFRQLTNTPIPPELYQITQLEKDVMRVLEQELKHFSIQKLKEGSIIVMNPYNIPNPKYHHWRYYNTPEYDREFVSSDTEIIFNPDNQIREVDCRCKPFKKGPRNISAPCSHLLALYLTAYPFLELDLKVHEIYKLNELEELQKND